MTKDWYPIIDYEKCTGCLECVRFCPHGVLEEQDGKPLVVNPDECVDLCRSCQKGICEEGAIRYNRDKEV